jgi:ribonuclease P protein component
MRVRHAKRRIGQDEAYLPAQQARAQKAPRISFPHGDQGWAQGHRGASRARPQGPERLIGGCRTHGPFEWAGERRKTGRAITGVSGIFIVKPPLRLKKRSQFLAMRSGARLGSRAFMLEMRKRPEGETEDAAPRFGFTVTKKTGNSVVRNRIRRRLREDVRLTAHEHARPGHDYVLVGKAAALDERFSSIVAEIARGLDQTGNIKANPPRNGRGREKRP